MPIDLTINTSAVTPVGELKFTAQEIAYLSSYLDRGDRGGYYMALYNMTGLSQCIEQAQIATFSEGSGGVAYASNFMLQRYMPAGYYPGIYFLSKNVSEYSLLAIRDKLGRNSSNENQNTGYITGQEMFVSANEAWKTSWPGGNLERYFPGNALSVTLGRLNADFQLPLIADEATAFADVVAVIAELWDSNNLSPASFRNRLMSEGTLFAAFASMGGGAVMGKQLRDYEGDVSYSIQSTPDGKYAVATNKQTNVVAGVFNVQPVPSSWADFLNRAAAALPSILAALIGGGFAGLAVSAAMDVVTIVLSDFHKQLSEFSPGFNGDIAPLVTNVCVKRRPPLGRPLERRVGQAVAMNALTPDGRARKPAKCSQRNATACDR